jgi:TetR/AcrR family tetracycline transcriptional repressor
MVSKTSHTDTESGRAPLQRESIVQTALALMNEIGLDALSLRRLAEELHVQAPALYWHFKNKQELLNEMATAMITSPTHEAAGPVDLNNGDWQTWLLRIGVYMRDALLKYRDGARLLAAAEVSTVSIQFMDMSLGVLVRAGFDHRSAMLGISTIVNYTMGFTFEEQASPKGQDAIEAFHALLATTDLPYLKAAFEGGVAPVESSSEFRSGLQFIIAGMATHL